MQHLKIEYPIKTNKRAIVTIIVCFSLILHGYPWKIDESNVSCVWIIQK